MTLKNAAQLCNMKAQALSGSSIWAFIRLRSKLRLNTYCPISKAPPISQYSTVGFHLMKFSS